MKYLTSLSKKQQNCKLTFIKKEKVKKKLYKMQKGILWIILQTWFGMCGKFSSNDLE